MTHSAVTVDALAEPKVMYSLTSGNGKLKSSTVCSVPPAGMAAVPTIFSTFAGETYLAVAVAATADEYT